MSIEWFLPQSKTGVVSFYATNITLNAVAMLPFEHAAYAKIGIDEQRRIIIRPVSKEMIDKHQEKNEGLFSVASKSSYARISNTDLCSYLSAKLGIPFGKKPTKGSSHYEEDIGLIVEMRKEE